MGIQQIPDQIKKAPSQGLRAIFSGIGRILMAADRPQATAATTADATGAPGGTPAGPAGRDAERRLAAGRSRQVPAPEPNRWRSLDQTGNVRLLSAEDLDDDDLDLELSLAADIAAEAAAAPAGLATSEEPAQTTAVTAAEAEPGPAAALPLPGYDSLSLASMRARLRGLDVDQLRTLIEYESKYAERAEVLGMFERRIEKLEAGR
jgi:hypothetical protein